MKFFVVYIPEYRQPRQELTRVALERRSGFLLLQPGETQLPARLP